MAEDKRLPLRLPYGQRYNPASDRLDSSESKGIGFKGPIKQDDHIVSEYSADRDIQYPSIYEGITPADLAAVMMAERLQRGTPRDVDQRAYDAAQRRVKEGRSPSLNKAAISILNGHRIKNGSAQRSCGRKVV